ncbi:hypothetical protein XCR_3221 [Xanthomonas campestris pv. raphani 756C]|nr:hypothetical protein XCR_3221 [Xanthomonas campestris pv. raphani 756C]
MCAFAGLYRAMGWLCSRLRRTGAGIRCLSPCLVGPAVAQGCIDRRLNLPPITQCRAVANFLASASVPYVPNGCAGLH